MLSNFRHRCCRKSHSLLKLQTCFTKSRIQLSAALLPKISFISPAIDHKIRPTKLITKKNSKITLNSYHLKMKLTEALQENFKVVYGLCSLHVLSLTYKLLQSFLVGFLRSLDRLSLTLVRSDFWEMTSRVPASIFGK